MTQQLSPPHRHASGVGGEVPTALVVGDSDSYVKWAAARATEIAEHFDTTMVVVKSATTPSAQQLADATAGTAWTPALVSMTDLVAALCDDPPDVLVLACRGPVIEYVLRRVRTRTVRQPVVVTGIPGLWFPPTKLGLRWRRLADVLVLHSHTERRLARGRNYKRSFLTHYGLASLMPAADTSVSDPDGPVIFAPQALVPREETDRLALLDGLIAAALANPEVPFVIKVRGQAGEAQTHRERLAYEDLAQSHERTLPPNLVVKRGPLAEHLAGARGLVTVSSTAALEAIGAGVPVLCLDDFGVSTPMINKVFQGSGLFGGLADLKCLSFRQPDPTWMRENYFHDVGDNDWVAVTEAALDGPARRDMTQVPTWRHPRHWPRTMLTRANALGDQDTAVMRAVYRVGERPARSAIALGRRIG